MPTAAFVSLCAAHALVGACLVAATVCDLRCRIIPNACVAGVLLAWLLRLAACCLGEEDIGSFVLAALAGLVAVEAPLLLVSRLAGGVGGGDVKLLGALGLLLGPRGGVAVILLSCAIAAACGLAAGLVDHVRGRVTCRRARASRHAILMSRPRSARASPDAARAGSSEAVPRPVPLLSRTLPLAPSVTAAYALVAVCGMGL